MEVWSCFFGNSRFWTIWKETIQEKGTQSTKCYDQSVMATFILFKCHRSTDNSIDFSLVILSWKSSW